MTDVSWTAIILALIVVMLIILLVVLATTPPEATPAWAHLNFWKAHLVETPLEIYLRSTGGGDEAAELALRRIRRTPRPTTEGYFLAATIIDRNLQENPREGGEDLRGAAEEYYQRALDNLAVAEDVAGRADAMLRPDAPPRPKPAFGAAFIIDAAVNFVVRRAAARGDPYFAAVAGADDATIALAEERRDDVIRSRREAAAEVAEATGANAAEAYLTLSRQHTSDPQNAHDTSVNAAKRSIIARLRDDQGSADRLPTLAQVREEIRGGCERFSRDPRTGLARPALTAKALEVVDQAARGHVSQSAGATDEEVLRRVWARADDPRNANTRGQIRQAVFDALVDGWTSHGFNGTGTYCVDGRIGRVVGALVLLDFDERNWGLHKLEHHKNEMFDLAAAAIRAAAESAAAQDENLSLQAAGRARLARTKDELDAAGEAGPEGEDEFVASARARVVAALEGYAESVNAVSAGALNRHILAGVKKEALAAL